MQQLMHDARHKLRSQNGFSLTEMLVTTLILGLVSTLMVTGIQSAIDVYHKTVDCANAQVALSTTVTALREELGTATAVKDSTGRQIIYLSDEGYWASIEEGASCKGFQKQYYKGDPTAGGIAMGEPLPLVPDAVFTANLSLGYGSFSHSAGDQVVGVSDLCVRNSSGDELASMTADYQILTRFAK